MIDTRSSRLLSEANSKEVIKCLVEQKRYDLILNFVESSGFDFSNKDDMKEFLTYDVIPCEDIILCDNNIIYQREDYVVNLTNSLFNNPNIRSKRDRINWVYDLRESNIELSTNREMAINILRELNQACQENDMQPSNQVYMLKRG